MSPEELARKFHETYERLAPSHGYETRKESSVPWNYLPDKNKSLMIAVCAEILEPLTAQREALLAACQSLVHTAPDHWIEDHWGLYEEARAAIAAATASEPCQGPDMSYLDAPCESEAEKP